MARSKSGTVQRRAFFQRGLTVDLDSKGQMAIKCHPMFERELRRMLRDIKAEARRIVRVNHHVTGKLERSIQVGPIRKASATRISGTVTAGSRLAPYARYVHEGTRRHIIRPQNPGSAMKFPGLEAGEAADGDVLRKKARHPGTQRDRFLNRAASRVVAAKYGGTVRYRR